MTISVRDGGTFKAVDINVRDAGVWRFVDGYVRDAGVWKQFYAHATVDISRTSASRQTTPPTTPVAIYQLDAAGTISTTLGTNALAVRGTWITPTSAGGADYACRATLISGSISGTFGTWLPLNADRTWSTSDADASMTLEIRRVADSVVLDTDTITFSTSNG